MSAAQPNPDLTALLERVRTQVRDCNLQEAILVDDNLDTGLTEERWIRAAEQLRGEDTVAFGKLQTLVGEKGTGNIQELPPEDVQAEAARLIHESTSRGAASILNQ